MIQNAVTEAILQRRSIRSFTEQPVSDEELDTVLECAVWAPSGMNQQTAVYAAVRDKDLLRDLAEDDKKFGRMGPPPGMKMPDMPGGMPPSGAPGGMPPGGMPPGGPGGPGGDRKLGYGAPCIVLIFDIEKERLKFIDPVLGEENLCLAAHSIGLGTCILGGMGAFEDPENAKAWKKRLGVPEGYEYVSAVALGRPAAPTEPKPRKNGRKLVF